MMFLHILLRRIMRPLLAHSHCATIHFHLLPQFALDNKKKRSKHATVQRFKDPEKLNEPCNLWEDYFHYKSDADRFVLWALREQTCAGGVMTAPRPPSPPVHCHLVIGRLTNSHQRICTTEVQITAAWEK